MPGKRTASERLAGIRAAREDRIEREVMGYATASMAIVTASGDVMAARMTVPLLNGEPVPLPDEAWPATVSNGNGAAHDDFFVVDPITFEGKPIPPREWAVEGMVPLKATTLLYGDGGLGKSLLAQMLATASAMGKDFLGVPTRSMRTLCMFAEDDVDEWQRRQAAVNDLYGCAFGDLERMRWVPRFGRGAELAVFAETGAFTTTALYHHLRREIVEFDAKFVVLDSLHDVFAGDENRRIQARRFIGALNGLAREIGGAVLALAHPSLTGLTSGSGASGSTAWNNAVRSRLYFERSLADDNVRILSVKKSNYAASGKETGLELRYERGAFVRVEQQGGGLVSRLTLDAKLLEAFRKMAGEGARIPADKSPSTSLPNRAKKLPEFKLYSWADLVAAQDRLKAAGKIQTYTSGPPSNRKTYLCEPAPEGFRPPSDPPSDPGSNTPA